MRRHACMLHLNSNCGLIHGNDHVADPRKRFSADDPLYVGAIIAHGVPLTPSCLPAWRLNGVLSPSLRRCPLLTFARTVGPLRFATPRRAEHCPRHLVSWHQTPP